MTAPVPNSVRTLAAQGALTAVALEDLIRDRALPLVEPDSCTFVHRGAADAVALCHFGVGLPTDLSFRRLDGSDLWYLVLDLPRGARLEYKLEVTIGGRTSMVEDALNPKRATNPYGANSVCEAFGYQMPEWARHDPDAPPGSLREASMKSLSLSRMADVTLYLPAGFGTGERHQLLVVHDGGDYLHYAAIGEVLDNLIHRGVIPPVVAALTHPENRLVEYADDPRHAAFLAEELVPSLEAELPLVGQPRGRCLMGASFGAVASLSSAARYPGYFGRLLLQSGSFARTDGPCPRRQGALWHPAQAFVDRFTSSPSKVSERVFVSAGRYESLICENRAFLPSLQGSGMDVRFVETLDGHNWESWRDQLGTALPSSLAS